MNDQTPRRLKGSLVERAAEFYNYGDPSEIVPDRRKIRRGEPAQPQPVVAQPAPPPLAAPVPVRDAPPPLARPMAAPVAAPASKAVAEAPTDPVSRRTVQIDRNFLSQGGMLMPGGAVTALAEEFRLIKRQLLITSRVIAPANTDRARMILVCSAKPDDGKTFCAINLALSMSAEKDVEILLVDADFAKPDVLSRLGLPEGPGLLDALAGTVADIEECVLDTNIPNLSLLPAGTRSSSDTELLASGRAHAILDSLAKANPRRIVIFDSPPVLSASPASVLAAHVGQVMMVVRADKTSESDLREAVSLLDGCENIQLVLNSVSFAPGGRRFGSYYGQEDLK